jgi:hypothetical protein
MIFEIDENERKRAKSPHELSMINLVGCHLVATPAAIVLDVGMLAFLIPLTLSLAVITFIWFRVLTDTQRAPWFVTAHWRLSANRTRILLIGYAVSALIMGLALMSTAGSDKADIMMLAISRVAVVPTLLAVMVCFVLESGAIYQAGRGEVPDGIVRDMPPPDALAVVESAGPAAANG